MAHRIIWHTEQDLYSRIREIREMREILLEREEELVMLHSALEGKENCVVDSKGKIIALGEKPKETTYQQMKPRQALLKKYREAGIVPKNRWEKKPVWE